MATGQAANIWDALPPADADRIHESSVGRLTLGELADMVMCSVKVLDLSVPFDFRHRAVVKWTLQHCPDWCPPRLPALHKPPRRRQPSAPEPPPKRARGDDDAAGAVRAAVVKTEPGEGPAPAPDAAVPALGDFVAFGEQGRPPGAAPAAASATPAPASDTPAPMGDFIAFQAPDPQPEPSPAAAAPVAAAPAPAADGAEPEHQFAAQFAAAHHFSDAFVAPGHGFAGGPPGPPHPVPGPGFPPSDAAPFAAPPHFTPAGPPPPYRAPSDPWAQAPQAPAPAPPSAPTDAQAKAAARRSKLAASIFSSSNATGLRPPVEAPRAPQAFGRKLSYLLRHGAQREGLSMRSDGFVPLVELLQRPDFRGVGIEDIEALVAGVHGHAARHFHCVTLQCTTLQYTAPQESECSVACCVLSCRAVLHRVVSVA